MKIQVFIFNYSRFEQSLELLNQFENENLETFIINCKSDKDPSFRQTKNIIKLPNVGYSGQWNKAIELANCDVLLIINSDVVVPNANKLINRMNKFYNHYKSSAIYAPNVDWTPWSFNPNSLKKLKFGFRKVPGTDSTIWSLRKEIALKVGKIDLNLNNLGWGIENLASYFSHKSKKIVVRDYKIKCQHPKETLYCRVKAMCQLEKWIKSLQIDQKYFWKLFHKREQYEFGCEKDEKLFI